MNRELEIFNKLYSDSDEEVFQALNMKKDWMFEHYMYAKGHIKTSYDTKGKVHYPFIESMLDETILFDDVKLHPSTPLDEALKLKIESTLNDNFQFATLYNKIDNTAPFWVQYDLNRIDDNTFNILFPNFFHKQDYDSWEIDVNNVNNNEDLIEQLKLSLVGDNNENVIIMDKNNLINGVFFAPVMTKIFFYDNIDEELKEELKSIAKEKEIKYEEVAYDRF